MTTPDPFIQTLVKWNIMAASALNMHPQEAIDEYNIDYGWELEDAGYLIHPDVIEITHVVNGNKRRAWRLRSNPSMPPVKTPRIDVLRAVDKKIKRGVKK